MTDVSHCLILSFSSANEWEKWLDEHHNLSSGIWVRMFKKASHIKTITYDQALDVALCYGWIDSQVKTYDEQSYIQKFTPRRTNSIWSKTNTMHIERLIREGKMKPAGMKQVMEAKEDGRWQDAYDSPTNMTLPDEFLDALSHNTRAKIFFDTLNKANRYAIAWRLQTAKRLETKAKRIRQIIEMLSKEKKFH